MLKRQAFFLYTIGVKTEMDSQIVVGVLEGNKIIPSNESEAIYYVTDWDNRAAWSWLRLQEGRRIDDIIKEAFRKQKVKKKKERKDILTNMVLERASKKQRVVQFIIDDNNIIKAVASLNHLLISPEEVKAITIKILTNKNRSYKYDSMLEGLISYDDTATDGFELGFKIDYGDILTRNAIRVSSFITVIQCFNPISFARIGSFRRFGIKPSDERVLRIKIKSELEPRLDEAIDRALENRKAVYNMLEYAKKNKVDPKEAKTILIAFCKAYGLGDNVILDVLDRLEAEDKTTYGMAQASSYIARHGEKFKTLKTENRKSRARESLATISAASLLITDPKVTYEQALKWLKGRFPKKKFEEWFNQP